MIVIANVNDRWVAITVFVERDLGVATASTDATCATCWRGKLGTPEEICRGTDNGLCLIDPACSQGSPANVVYYVCIYIVYVIRDTIARVRLELSRRKLNRLTIVCALVVVIRTKTITTTDIVCTECAGRIKESGSVREKTAAYRIRLNMLLLLLLLLL